VTLGEAAGALRERRVSSVELTRSALDRIERLNPRLNAFLALLPEYALERAAQADRELAAGTDRGPLDGIPVGVKDVFDMRGVRTTGGGRIYGDEPAVRNAAVVERLEAAGAVIVGKLNLHELAYGVTSENPHFGPVRNPWNPEHSAGGSSGGSGAAVAAELVFAALGTDTGGSVRIPASFCGTVGFKPTFGLVSRFGTQALGFSLDHVGPLTRSVSDAAAVLDIMAGFDSRDPASVRHPATNYVPEESGSLRGIRIGIPELWLGRYIDTEVENAFRGAATRAVTLGAEVKPVNAPDLDAVNTLGQVLLLAEAAAIFERFLEHRDRFGTDVLALVDQGRLIPATDYINAQRLRRQLQADFERVWAEVNCLITPATSITAPRLGQTTVRIAETEEPVRPLATRFSRPFNVLGTPAISLPCGFTAGGLPIGLQVTGPPFQDALVLRVATVLERTDLPVQPSLADK
jgi:aspartyl-tRNA(Asn)/glutamyl-tRNA(Gln) amidotransferase subunit A